MKYAIPIFWILGAIITEITQSHAAVWIIFAILFSFLFWVTSLEKMK